MATMATFPLLRTVELVPALQEIGCQVNADDIDRPTSTKIVPIYAWFLGQLTQLTLEDVMMAAQLQLDAMDDQEIYREVVHVNALWATLNQVMSWACLDDFSPKDIRDPQPARIRRILSALLNFYLFEQDQISRLETLEEQSEELAKAEHEAERKHVELTNAIERKRAEMEANAAQSAVIEKENEEMRQVLLEKRSAASALANKIETDKRQRQNLQSRLESLQQTVSSHEVELQRLRSRIVQSPNRVKQTLSDLSKNVARMKDEILESEAKGRDYQARIFALKKYEGELTALIRTVEEWEAELSKANDGEARLARLFDERDTRLEDVKELELRSQQLGRRIKAATEQKERHGTQADAKKKALQKRMQELQENHEMLMVQRQDVDEEAAKRQRAIALKEKEILELVKVTESDLAQGEAAYRELKMEVLAYSARLNKALDFLNTRNSIVES